MLCIFKVYSCHEIYMRWDETLRAINSFHFGSNSLIINNRKYIGMHSKISLAQSSVLFSTMKFLSTQLLFWTCQIHGPNNYRAFIIMFISNMTTKNPLKDFLEIFSDEVLVVLPLWSMVWFCVVQAPITTLRVEYGGNLHPPPPQGTSQWKFSISHPRIIIVTISTRVCLHGKGSMDIQMWNALRGWWNHARKWIPKAVSPLGSVMGGLKHDLVVLIPWLK